jgi:hypothetical protein
VPESRWTAAAAAGVAAGLDEEVAANGAEDDEEYWFRVGTHYMGSAEAWEDAPYVGPSVGVQLDGLTIAVPATWGPPTDDGGVLRWTLADATFSLAVRVDESSIPTPQGWMESRRREVRGSPWQVVGGRQCPHAPALRAIELAEARGSAPRTMRVTRWVWMRPELVELRVETPDAVPAERGRELVAAFRSLRQAAR